jgi:hypothetical protein
MTRRQSNSKWSGGIAAHPDPPSPKKNPSAKISWKFIASIFWDKGGILFIDYLPKTQTINEEYYSSLLVQLKDILKEKSHGNFTNRILFLYNSASAHPSLAT